MKGQMISMWASAPDSGGAGGVVRCKMCHRVLKHPQSIARGIGPKCGGWSYTKGGRPRVRKLKIKSGGRTIKSQGHLYADGYIPSHMTEGLILRREDGRVTTNVPHFCCHHSPAGYEWGYPGSGPADLALNIAEALLLATGHDGPRREDPWSGSCFTMAWRLHHPLKRAFITGVPKAGTVLVWEELKAWVLAYVDKVEAAQAHLEAHPMGIPSLAVRERIEELEEGDIPQVLEEDLRPVGARGLAPYEEVSDDSQ